MKKFFFLITLVGILFFLNSCTTTRYVVSEPAYVEYSRPTRPSDQHIWLDGDWVWSRKSNTYVRSNGHWQKQRHQNVYTAGSWRSSPQGLYWQPGHWQR